MTAFDYAKDVLRGIGGENDFEFYMVGDYPKIDLVGGKKAGMSTVLVETGIYDPSNPQDVETRHLPFMASVDHTVAHIEAAVDLIIERHK